MDILDLVDSGISHGNACHACDRDLFAGFEDKGWMFSKVLAIAVAGFLTWFLVAVKLIPFTAVTCIVVCLVCAAVCILLYRSQQKKGIDCLPEGKAELIFWEEILFFAVFLMWTYLAGFRPQAYGTEKFMDYGFMEAMMRSTTLPAKDLWYSEGTINYYSIFSDTSDGSGQAGEGSYRKETLCTCFIRNSCGNFCIYCGKHALCGLLQDHSVDPDTAGEETRQLLVPGCYQIYRL